MSNSVSQMNELDCLRAILSADSTATAEEIIALAPAISALLPTSDPHVVGAWWNNGTQIVISNG